MKQGRVSRPRSHVHAPPTQTHDDSRTQRERQRGQAEAAAIKREMEDILDEIDRVLETNAEEFLQGYVQRGGE